MLSIDDDGYAPAYYDRYVAFVDILGFADFIYHVDVSTPGFDLLFLKTFLMMSADSFAELSLEQPIQDFQRSTFSDNVIVSAPINEQGIANVIHFCFQFAWILLRNGHFCRGSIVRGPLYHQGGIVFGRALVDAYRIESQIADVPRILLRSDVVEDVRQGASTHRYLRDFRKQIVRCQDGPFMINLFTSIALKTNRWTEKMPAVDDIDISLDEDLRYLNIQRGIVRDILSEKLRAATDNPKIYRNIAWIVKQFNDTVAGSNRSLRIVPDMNA
jgi:hypothetical protein